jgi:hypothetical protein
MPSRWGCKLSNCPHGACPALTRSEAQAALGEDDADG